MKKTYIIAEAGVNHNGDRKLAEDLVRAAAAAGADAVKFQTFRAEELSSPAAEMADYQKKNTGKTTSQLEMLKSLELPREWHLPLKSLSESLGLEFLSTPFEPGSLHFLACEVKVKKLKLGSGELTNGPLLYAAGATGLPVILSTGMGNLQEIGEALSVLKAGYENRAPAQNVPGTVSPDFTDLKEKVTLLHCVTNYPVKEEDVNLLAMDLLRDTFGLPVGYSDHTLGPEASLAAAARGACTLEKHITLDKSLPGPDHAASMNPEEFRGLVAAIRKIDLILGRRSKSPVEAEIKIARVARKSLVAASAISRGQLFTVENLAVKRPGDGVSPMKYWEYLGKPAQKNYEPGELID